jgi:hypothetical protein
MTTEQKIQDLLYMTLESIADTEVLDEPLWGKIPESSAIKSVRSFDDVGMLTKNKGLVVNLKDGTEFQLTIVVSK